MTSEMHDHRCRWHRVSATPMRKPRLLRLFGSILCSVFVLVGHGHRALADDGLSYIRDAEIESTLRTFYDPIFKAAGLDTGAVHVYIVNDPSLNSFVAGGQNVFINTGTIMRSETPNQLIGIAAHETGHIAGGHLVRFDAAMHNASIEGMIATAIGIGVSVLAHGASAGGAAMAAGQDVGLRHFLQFSVAQEASADAAALKFLDRTHQSARGLLQFFEILQQDELMSGITEVPYLRTHPLTSERIDVMREHVEQSPYSNNPDPPEWVELHKRMKAKLIAFLQSPAQTLRQYPETDTSIAARYARAIAEYRMPDLDTALKLINELIAVEPRNAYFEELKGQMLFEGGRVQDAVQPYQKSVQLAPDALLKVELAQVEIETEDPTLVKDALTQLKSASRYEDQNPDTWRLLAVAYGRSGDMGDSALSQAEQAVADGDLKLAGHLAERAIALLPPGPSKLRAQDIQIQAQQTKTE